MEFEQVIENFSGGDRLVIYHVGEDGKRGEPIKSWKPTVPERVRVLKATAANPQGRAIFKLAEPSGKLV